MREEQKRKPIFHDTAVALSSAPILGLFATRSASTACTHVPHICKKGQTMQNVDIDEAHPRLLKTLFGADLSTALLSGSSGDQGLENEHLKSLLRLSHPLFSPEDHSPLLV